MRQPVVASDLARQIQSGSQAIFGVMLESFIVAGRQEVRPGQALTYGQSITDGCLGFAETRPVLEALAEAVLRRRALA
jgi:3-deoxy-7-phosphoheptulonate synthase